jgi:hypothetical protein
MFFNANPRIIDKLSALRQNITSGYVAFSFNLWASCYKPKRPRGCIPQLAEEGGLSNILILRELQRALKNPTASWPQILMPKAENVVIHLT